MKSWMLLALAVVLAVHLGGCAALGERSAPADRAAEAAPSTGGSRDVLQQQVAREARSYLSATAGQGPEDVRLVRRDPYYLRTCDVYPEGLSNLQIEMRETDSRTAPYAADVQVVCQRISTPMHRSRDAALQDETFLRDTGMQVVSYEYRNRRWVRTGSLFLVDRTDRWTGSGWAPVEGTPQRVAPGAADGGWFRRSWSRIRGD